MTTELVLITGMSGSGKSVALHALEDAGYFCVDNLPPEMLEAFVELVEKRKTQTVAVAIDVRSAHSLPQLPPLFEKLRAKGVQIKSVFLNATTDTLVRRYSETRRKHPLTGMAKLSSTLDQEHALVEAIDLERELLSPLQYQAHLIDTSLIRTSQLQAYVKSFFSTKGNIITLVFESFAFKRGIPLDADYVFDVRMLPNPHYETGLKELTGKDAAVADFLAQQEPVLEMRTQIENFIQHWLPALAQDHRSYVTVAIGCTGGQHRSVYIVEQLAENFQKMNPPIQLPCVVLKRHRELDYNTKNP